MPEGLIPARSADLSPYSDERDHHRGTSPEQGPLDRPLAAVRRYKWLILGVTLLASVAGALGSRFVTPRYEVRATVWIENSSPRQGQGAALSGPIRSAELLSSGAWVELFRSYRVVDEVVRRLSLYIAPADAADKPLFAGLALADPFLAGSYELALDPTGKRWILATVDGAEVERGEAVDSIGRKLGFKWMLPASAFEGNAERKVRFTVVPPREKSLELLSRVGTRLVQGSNFLWLTFS
ncbi:MAG: Wzz/FepE/Etk N-terminal domain-containing protein, partial [Vicinamibacterales bacterium]